MKISRAAFSLRSFQEKYFPENIFILFLAMLIGIVSGLAAITLKTSVHFIQLQLEKTAELVGSKLFYLPLPFIGILITVLIARYFLKENPGHGISQIIYSISKNSGIVRKTKMYSQMLTSAITVGFGGSVGLESPIVVTGSAIGSNLGRMFLLDYKKRTLFIGCGAAGAISAIFNSPIAGVIFAIEVLLTDITINKFIPILIASVFGQVISTVFLGEEILFSFKLVDKFQIDELVYFVVLGVVCGFASLYFSRVVLRVEKKIQDTPNFLIRALLGGLGLAIIIFIFPPIYGEGYDTIKLLLNNQELNVLKNTVLPNFNLTDIQFLIFFLLGVLLLKPVATALTIGAGGCGGIFAPSLFMGGIVGFCVSVVLNMLFPDLELSVVNFTLVGMCGMMSGILHAPLTAIFLIAEITGGYMLFVPLMLVSAISYATIQYFEKYSIYTKLLVEKGDFNPYDRDKIVLNQINFKKIIEKDIHPVAPDATLQELVQAVKKSKRNIFPVVNQQGELEGIVTLDDIRECMFDIEQQEKLLVKNFMHKPPEEVFVDEPMDSVMNKFETTQAWNLPIVDEKKYVGIISKSRIFNFYRKNLISHSKD